MGRAIAWSLNTTPEQLRHAEQMTAQLVAEMAAGSRTPNTGNPWTVAKRALRLVCTNNAIVRNSHDNEVTLFHGQFIWCLDGAYYAAEDVTFQGVYRVRRGPVSLNSLDILLAVREGKIMPLHPDTEVYDLPVEVIP
jgi:hypothetical protein